MTTYTTSKVFTTSGDDELWYGGADDYVYIETGVTLARLGRRRFVL